MFGFGKKQNKSLLIMGTDVVEIIKSDYENDMAFTLIEFLYEGKQYTMGSCVLPANAEECKVPISEEAGKGVSTKKTDKQWLL